MRSSTRIRMTSPKTSTVPPPRLFAWYIAASAFESSGVASLTRALVQATPMLAVMKTSSSPAAIGLDSACERPLGVRHGVGFGVVPVEQDQELVAAEPGDDLGRAVGRFEATRHGHEDLVAHLVAEPVVDGLEAVEVEDEHGDRARSALPLGQRVGEAVREQRPVGQARQRVVEIGVGQGLLGRLVLVLVVEEAADAQVGTRAHDVGRARTWTSYPSRCSRSSWRGRVRVDGAQRAPHRFELAPHRLAVALGESGIR